MNFLLVNYEYPPLGGGAGNATMFIARSMAQAGHRPVVLTSAFGDLPEHEQTGGVTVHRVKARRRSPDRSDQLQMASFTAAALRVVRRIADAERIDAAIAFFTIPSAPVTWWLWRTTRVPYAISLRGGDVPGHVPGLRAIHHALTPFRRTMLRRAIAVVANSDSLARLAQRADRLPVRMIPNG
ncbi:MAG TPA: glycosyltransferase, partial [Burkholderiales bacterium]|nr:glycosyltransferase [Burkholderiales bacterium]